jgi:hypothetical protein
METLVKLRDTTYQNAYLVMQNNELALDNSFMTPAQKAAIQKAKAEQSPLWTLLRERSPIGKERTQLIRGHGTVAKVGVLATPAPTSNVTTLSNLFHMRNGRGAC